MTPGKLPEEFIRKPARHLGELQAGESGWFTFTEMKVDSDRNCYLNPNAEMRQRSEATIQVTRTTVGFEVFIPASDFRWIAGGGLDRYNGYVPVTKVEVCSD